MVGRAPTAFYLHPDAPLHDTGWGHPEHQGRLRALASTVGRNLLTLHDRVEQRDARPATEEELRRVHTADHVRRVRRAVARSREEGLVRLDPDTVVSPASWGAATGSAGVRIDPRYFRPTETHSLLGDASKARSMLGWRPETSFEDMVREMVDADLRLAEREASLQP